MVLVWNQSYLGLGKGEGVRGDTRGDLAPGTTVWALVLGTDREFFCSAASGKGTLQGQYRQLKVR